MNKVDLIKRNVEVTRKLVIEKCRNDFFTYLKYMFPNKEVTWNWHHKYVCGLLQEWAVGDIKKLMVFMPPQHSKSTMLTEYLPSWVFGVNPNAECLLIMYNATMAAKYNRKIQRIIDNPLYKEIFPNTRLNEKNVVTTAQGNYVRNSEEFQIVGHRGFLKATGVGGGIAGNPAKYTFMDDVIKNAAEANSATYREKIYEWQTDELEARQHNDSRIAFTITRRHEDDLAGRLIKRDGIIEEGGLWKVVKLPALKEDNHDPNDPREIGEALFPALHSRERMEEVRDKKPKTFSGLYQQRPAPLEGGILKRKYFKIIKKEDLPPYFNNIDFVLDSAYTAKQENDPSASLCYGIHDNAIYLLNYMRVWEEFGDLTTSLPRFVKANGNAASRLFVEPKASGKSIVQYLSTSTDLNVYEYEMLSGDRMSRLQAVIPFMQEDRKMFVVEGDWNEQFIGECITFPNATHDEAIDNITMALDKSFGRSSEGFSLNWTN